MQLYVLIRSHVQEPMFGLHLTRAFFLAHFTFPFRLKCLKICVKLFASAGVFHLYSFSLCVFAAHGYVYDDVAS